MDADFWADTINDIFGGIIALIFGQSVSQRIDGTLEKVTSATTILPNPDVILPFVQAVAAISLLLTLPVALVNLAVGMVTRRERFISRFFVDLIGTYLIAVFGLTLFSVGNWFSSVAGQTATDLSRALRGTEGPWFQALVTAFNAINPAQSTIDHFVAEAGGWLLILELDLLNIAVLPAIMLLMLAFVFRNNTLAKVFLTFALAVIFATLFSRVSIAMWLATAAWMLSWAPVSFGVSESFLLAGTFIGAALIPVAIFGLFLTGGMVVRAQVIGSKKDKAAEEKEEVKRAAAAQQRAAVKPAAQPEYSAASSASMRERAQAAMGRGQQLYAKGNQTYGTVIEKTENTQRVSHNVVMVADTTRALAMGAGVRFATVPYVPVIAAGVAGVATIVSKSASKTEAAATRVLDVNQKARAYIQNGGNANGDNSSSNNPNP